MDNVGNAYAAAIATSENDAAGGAANEDDGGSCSDDGCNNDAGGGGGGATCCDPREVDMSIATPGDDADVDPRDAAEAQWEHACPFLRFEICFFISIIMHIN